MNRSFIVCVGMVLVSVALGVPGLAQSKSKKKGEEPPMKFENEKAVMKEMSACMGQMQGLDNKISKESEDYVEAVKARESRNEIGKRLVSISKLRKDLADQAERMGALSEAWRPFVKPEKAKLADLLVSVSQDAIKAAKPTKKDNLGSLAKEIAKSFKEGEKESRIHKAVMAVRLGCGECHRGYKPKDESAEKKEKDSR